MVGVKGFTISTNLNAPGAQIGATHFFFFLNHEGWSGSTLLILKMEEERGRPYFLAFRNRALISCEVKCIYLLDYISCHKISFVGFRKTNIIIYNKVATIKYTSQNKFTIDSLENKNTR
uniref:Uncharacterized protein n=1 Tax=Cacopsylla melanoneura TaxID=428564 RepID=A0A8D8PT38_9HEMI